MVEQTTMGIRVRVLFSVPEAIQKAEAALKDEGFGILTRIDVQQTLKQKINVDFPPYVILGACNPPLAHRALSAEREVGLLLPCNVTVYADGNETVIAAMDPTAGMQMLANDELHAVASEAKARLERALNAIAASG